jgi:outer membrane protein assembly factor BamD (BamD/ComL family)
MSSYDDQSPPATLLFRGVAIFILFLAITLCGFQVLAALSELGQQSDNLSKPALFVPAVLTLVGGIAFSTVLEGMARLIVVQQPGRNNSSAMTIRLLTAISDLQAALPGMLAQAQSSPAATEAVIDPALSADTALIDDNTPISAITDPAHPAVPASIETHLQHMIKLLEEMKEVSMLDESQRQNRRKQVLGRRKGSRLEEAARMINHQKWEEADALLHLLESLHPGDSDVQASRNQFNDARIASQADEWDQLRRNVDELLAGSKYEEALLATTGFLDRFPTHPDCQQLVVRIRHDLQVYNESLSNTLYEDIKAKVEARQWRTALDAIQQFLDQFPDHIRAAKIRNQVRVIQKNAEIEERHDLEDRIRDAINNKQYADAASMSEDLLARYPDSPQTAYLTDLLPKLRERAGISAENVEIQDIVT